MPRKSYPRGTKRGVFHGYRSGLEKAIRESLKKRQTSFTYESHKVPFTEPAKKRHYTPDFFLSNGIVIESKGRFLSKDRQKHLLVKDQHPDLEVRFVFSRASAPIYKGSKTTNASWAEKYGFQWAERDIPDEWLKEKPRKKWLKALERLVSAKTKT
jgi:hypothetical protein